LTFSIQRKTFQIQNLFRITNKDEIQMEVLIVVDKEINQYLALLINQSTRDLLA